MGEGEVGSCCGERHFRDVCHSCLPHSSPLTPSPLYSATLPSLPPLPLFSLAPHPRFTPFPKSYFNHEGRKILLNHFFLVSWIFLWPLLPPPPNSPNPRPLSLYFYFVRLCLSFTGERKWVYLDKGGRAREKKEGKKLNEYYGICEYCNFLFFANFLLLFKILFLCVFFFSLV